jgi:hypothetical protein
MLSLHLHLVFPSTIMKRPNLQNEVSKFIPKKIYMIVPGCKVKE